MAEKIMEDFLDDPADGEVEFELDVDLTGDDFFAAILGAKGLIDKVIGYLAGKGIEDSYIIDRLCEVSSELGRVLGDAGMVDDAPSTGVFMPLEFPKKIH